VRRAGAVVIARFLRFFREPPEAPRLTDEAAVDRDYRRLRPRMLAAAMGGYALFYFTRKNISVALPLLSRDLGYTNAQLGILGSLLYASYAVSKPLYGLAGDRADGRRIMVVGLVLSALVNLAFPLSTGLAFFGALWFLNGAFQSAAGPACAKTTARWFSVSERGTWWAVWNTSHMLGGGGVLLLAGWLGAHGGWQAVFVGPALLCLAGAVVLYVTMGDRPETFGLPPVEVWRRDPEQAGGPGEPDGPFWQGFLRHVLFNRALLLLAGGSLCTYVVRYGALDWAAKFLVEAKGQDIATAATVTSLVEFAGIPGCLAAGWVSDRCFGARRAPVCVFLLAALAGSLWLFRAVPPGHPWLDALALSLTGFLTYGPQMLLAGVGAADACGSRWAAAAVGVTGAFSYVGAIVAGAGTGLLVDSFGWDGGFALWSASALAGAVLVVPLWNSRGRQTGRVPAAPGDASAQAASPQAQG